MADSARVLRPSSARPRYPVKVDLTADQFGNRYGRRFDTHWDFVRYAREKRMNLDFTTTPQRPDRKLPPLFEE